MTRSELLQRYADVARPIMRRYFSADSCVNGTRVTLEVLRKFNIPAFPLVVEVAIMNPAMVERAGREHRIPQTPEERQQWFKESGAHGVGIGMTDAPRTPMGWAGHLVTIAAGHWLIDVSLDQATRPQHNILMPPVLLIEGIDHLLTTDDYRDLVVNDCLVSYKAHRGRQDFMPLPGYRYEGANVTVAREILAALKSTGR